MAAELKSVQFDFSDGTIVTFRRSSERWISWSAVVSTSAERLQFRREKRVATPGTWFRDDCLQPSLIHAQRLITRAAAQRAEQRERERRVPQPA